MTTKLSHPQAVPLRKFNVDTTLAGRKNTTTNRKSAVQILQETKAFYVKSETVLDKKQEFRPSKGSESIFNNFAQGEKTLKIEDNNNKLQDKLRILLDFDQVENIYSKRSAFKSLPDLHFPPTCYSAESSIFSLDIKFDGDSKSAYSGQTQPRLLSMRSVKSGDCNHFGKTKNIDDISGFQKHSKIYASFREPKSGELFSLKNEEIQFAYNRHYSCSSSKSQHNFSSKNSQSADSGRQSQGGSTGLRTKWSGFHEFCSSSQNICSDSGTEDDIPFLFRNENSNLERKRPILRSKSDISNKYCVEPRPMSPPLPTIEKLEKFFDHLGMDTMEYKEFASDNSGSTSPIFFSSVSSIDSCIDMTNWNVPEPCKMAECPSIVERNARIIKWLYNCQKKVTYMIFYKCTAISSCIRQLRHPPCFAGLFFFSEETVIQPLTGKFYARHDFPDPSLQDPLIESAILKKHLLMPKDIFKEPVTTNMDYGWYWQPQRVRDRHNFFYPKQSTWISKIGAIISMENQKNPKKMFKGLPFKL